MHQTTPDVSVLVPTFGRPETALALLRRLDAQTVDPARFEVVLVDDGSPDPVAVDPDAHRFRVLLLRQANAGPAAARNLGLEHCRAALTLILNDDAVPDPRLIEEHLEAHASAPERTAVLGSFPFTPDARRHPFVQLLEESDLLFDFMRLSPGCFHDWTYFWTCNISLSTEALREVGGFDAELFRDAIVEDVELGYRLEQRGWRVLYHPEAHCAHDHRLTAAAYLRRHVLLGKNQARMARKHGDPGLVSLPPDQPFDAALCMQLQAVIESRHELQKRVVAQLENFEVRFDDTIVPPELCVSARNLVRRAGRLPLMRGLLMEIEGVDPWPVMEQGPPAGKLTSIVVLSHQSRDQLQRCIQRLRDFADERHPIEILVVDNGSTDGSAEWLATQSDLRAFYNEENVGAPRARNQAIPHARGEWFVFMDSDVMVTAGWLRRMLYHGEVEGAAGCVGPVTNRSAHGHPIETPPLPTPEALDAFAAQRAANFHRKFRYGRLMTSFCILVHRDVVERIGGFDERFNPWGFEDDDFSLRARLAGWRLRLAQDVFVLHEEYFGEKAARHDELLFRNWRRFAAKWGLPNAHAHGDYTGLDELFDRDWSDAELFVPLEPAAPLPETAARLQGAAPTARTSS